jgi:hypothetical protein
MVASNKSEDAAFDDIFKEDDIPVVSKEQADRIIKQLEDSPMSALVRRKDGSHS